MQNVAVGSSNGPLAAAGQVEGVDPGVVDLVRAEWVESELCLRFESLAPDASKRFTFRIVGVEPRIWDLTAPSGTSLAVTAIAVVVTMPLVAADVVLTPGSY